jgi:hypothetical protein
VGNNKGGADLVEAYLIESGAIRYESDISGVEKRQITFVSRDKMEKADGIAFVADSDTQALQLCVIERARGREMKWPATNFSENSDCCYGKIDLFFTWKIPSDIVNIEQFGRPFVSVGTYHKRRILEFLSDMPHRYQVTTIIVKQEKASSNNNHRETRKSQFPRS